MLATALRVARHCLGEIFNELQELIRLATSVLFVDVEHQELVSNPANVSVGSLGSTISEFALGLAWRRAAT